MAGHMILSIPGLLWDNGPFCVVVSQVGTAFMNLAIKVVARDISIYSIIFIRSFMLTLIILGMGISKKIPELQGPRNLMGLLFCRGFTGAIGMISFVLGVYLIPIGDASALNQAYIVFIIFLSWSFKLEKINWIMAAGVISCLAGELLVSRPPFLFGENVEWDAQRIAGICISLVGALFMGIGFLTVGFIGKSVHSFTMILWQHTMGFLFIFPIMVWDIAQQGFGKLSALDVLMLAGVVLGGVTRQVFLTRGLQISNAVVGTSVATIGIALTYAIGLIFLHESISILAGLGLVSVMAGIMIVALGKARLKKEIAYNRLPPDEIELESCESLELKNGNMSSNL